MFPPIFFIGMSKNCFQNLKINLEYLIKFKLITDFKIKICIIDSDSTDGTKPYCSKLYEKGDIDSFIEIDNLENSYPSRIERLSICRNEALNYIKNENHENALYVPMDMDLDLFSLIKFEQLRKIIISFNSSDMDAMFPFSIPYYYDIFALRSENWVEKNNLLLSKKYKDRLIFFSFIINFFLIFRFQKNIKRFDSDFINVNSAFGGIALYKVNNELLETAKYDISKVDKDYYSEHLFFNGHFKNLKISKNWNIVSPHDYTFFNSYGFNEKLIYILKTFKSDFIKFTNYFKK